MTMITFNNDEQRENFRFQMCLQTLKAEATNTMGIRFYRGSIVNVLKKWIQIYQEQKNLLINI